MVTTTRVVRVDDLDGSTDDVQTVWIGLDGDLYEIDLSAAGREQLRTALEPFTAHARSVLLGDEDPSARPASRPGPVGHGPVKAHRVRQAALPFEDPAYPWIPFKSAGPVLAQQVRAWAGQRGIPMPHRGIPRSVLQAYRQHERAARNGSSMQQ